MNDTLQALAASFAWPWWLAALPLPWLVRRLLPAATAGAPPLRTPWGERLLAIEGHGGAVRRAPIGILPWLAWALLCIAAARPQALGEVVQPPQSARDLMLAVDLSRSMDERDIVLAGRRVTRLTAAKAVIADFLERRSGDRVGLIVFGERAYALTPLTHDLRTVREQLDATVTRLAGDATAIGDAIALATRRLQTQPAEQRVLILLTDGVNTAGALDPGQAARIAGDAGVRIHTIALGGLGVPMPVPDSNDATNEDALRRIADATGGRAFVAGDAGQLAGIYGEIERLEPVEREGQPLRPRIECYPWPLAASLLCALLALALRRGGGAGRPA
jgi:Ca-activated chloride channel family protein